MLCCLLSCLISWIWCCENTVHCHYIDIKNTVHCVQYLDVVRYCQSCPLYWSWEYCPYLDVVRILSRVAGQLAVAGRTLCLENGWREGEWRYHWVVHCTTEVHGTTQSHNSVRESEMFLTGQKSFCNAPIIEYEGDKNWEEFFLVLRLSREIIQWLNCESHRGIMKRKWPP